MNTDNVKSQPQIQDDEIDLVALIKTVWINRIVLLKVILTFGLLGLLIAVFSPKEYTAKTIIVPQVGEGQSKLGGLSSLAAMAGFNISAGVSGSDLSPSIYPQIVSSVPFQLELMNTPLDFNKYGKSVTLLEYYTQLNKPSIFGYIKKYTIGLPGVILSAIRGKSLQDESLGENLKKTIHLNEDQRIVIKILEKLVFLEANAKEGYLTLTAKLPEAVPSAQLAQRAQELLQQYIIDFKVKKTKANLDFIQQRFDETEKKFEAAQDRLAQFRDRNKNVSSAAARTEEERLNSQYNMIYGVYSELAKQLEQAKIQVKQDTPVFTIVEPVSVPMERSKPKRFMILFVWVFLGGVVGTGIIFGKQYYQTFKARWDEKG